MCTTYGSGTQDKNNVSTNIRSGWVGEEEVGEGGVKQRNNSCETRALL